jgi:CHAT domain-containing protein
MLRRAWPYAATQALVFAVLLSIPWGGADHPEPAVQKTSLDQMMVRAAALKSKGKFQEAETTLTEAAALAESVGVAGKAAWLFELGLIKWNLGKIVEASKFFSAALEAGRQGGAGADVSDPETALKIIEAYNMGKALRSQNQYERAKAAFAEAIRASRLMGRPEFELKCLRQASLACFDAGDLAGFLAATQGALEIAKRLNHRLEMSRCLNNIGVYYMKVHDYAAALGFFNEALGIAESLGEKYEISECLLNLGDLYLNLGSYNQAENNLNMVLNIKEFLKDQSDAAFIYSQIGILKYRHFLVTNDINELKQSKGYFEKAIEIIGPTNTKDSFYAPVYNNLGIAYFRMQDFDLAQETLEMDLQIAKKNHQHEWQKYLNLNLGDTYFNKKEYDCAFELYQWVINKCSPTTDQHLLQDAWTGLGRIYEVRGDLDKALDCFSRAQECAEVVRDRLALDYYQVGFARDKYTPYVLAMDVLFRIYSKSPSASGLDAMIRLAEKAKAGIFLENLTQARVEKAEASGLSNRTTEFSRAISSAFLKLRNAGLSASEKQRLQDYIEDQEQRYLALLSEDAREAKKRRDIGSVALSSAGEISRRLLDDRAALLEYFLGEKRSYLIFVNREEAGVLALPGKRELEESVRVFLKLTSRPIPGDFEGRDAAKRMGAELLPVLMRESFRKIDTLIVVPDGVLFYLPFESLITGRSDGASYLVEDYDVSYAPSASSLMALKIAPRQTGKKKTLLALGAPSAGFAPVGKTPKAKNNADVWREAYVEGGFGFGPLPFSKKEVRAVADELPVGDSDVFTGRAASESLVKMLPLSAYRIIHFACHGLLDESIPMRSAVVLSPSEDGSEDGFLQVREVYGLKLDADMVVLSACQTGKGVLESGEGLMGLPRTFFLAGSRSVVSTLWAVGDRTTADFMRSFYGHLRKGESKSRALRLAKISMIRSPLSHPAFWAGYVLSGDPAPVFGAE